MVDLKLLCDHIFELGTAANMNIISSTALYLQIYSLSMASDPRSGGATKINLSQQVGRKNIHN